MRRITRISIVILAVALVLLVRRPLTLPRVLQGVARRPPVLVFTGDILLAGRIGKLIDEKGAGAPLAGVSDVLREADLAIGNLECPIGTTGRPEDKTYTFRAKPKSAETLAEAHIDVVTLANNHTVDYGTEALLETLEALKRHQIVAVGAGKDIDDARRFTVLERGSPPIKIAVLAFSNMLPVSFYATPDRPGTNPAYPGRIKEDVAAAREQADLVIVLFHWGEELSPTPSGSQRYLAGVAADAGADLVIGHHPHVLQGFERRGRALVAYSLGNFLFPSRGDASQSMMLRYVAGPDGSGRAEVIPCVIDGFRPRLASGPERRKVLDHIAAISEPLGVRVLSDGSIALPAPTRVAGGRR